MKPKYVALISSLYALPFSLVAFCIIFLYSRHSGIGISPDSIVYISAARNFLTIKTFVSYNSLPVVDFPLFYPIFLAFTKLITTVDPVMAGPYINGILFATIIFLASVILNKFINQSLVYKAIILACIVVAPCLQEVYSMLWSETIFILFVLFFIIGFYKYFQTHSITGLVSIALIVSLSCVTRYAGVALVGAGGALLFFDRSLTVKRKIIHISIFSFVAMLLLAINFYHNMKVAGFLTGNREKGITPLTDNISYYGAVVGNWLPFFPDQYSVSLIVGIVVMLALIIACIIYYVIDKKWYGSYENITTVLALVYSSFIIISSTLSHYEKINDRLLSPLYIPLLLSFTCRIPALIQMKKQKWLRYASIVFSIIIASGFFYRQYLNDKEFYDDVHDLGIPGYTDDSWQYSQTVNFVKDHKLFFKNNYCIYSNAPESIYFNCGLKGEDLPNGKFAEDVRTFFKENNFYVVWFYNKPETALPLQEIQKNKTLKTLAVFNDGAIYFCEKKFVTKKNSL